MRHHGHTKDCPRNSSEIKGTSGRPHKCSHIQMGLQNGWLSNLSAQHHPTQCQRICSKMDPKSMDMENIPEAYQDFSDVFSKAKADTLAPHQPYNLKITLEDGTTPPQPPIYSLSNSKLGTLWEFIDEHLNIGFIRPSHSSHGTPILFVKKKDGLLQLCVNFQSLNRVTKKDHYPLPLITDLLDVPWKARIYTKINLQHTYHLVWITEGDKWKMAFWTHYGSFEWLVCRVI